MGFGTNLYAILYHLVLKRAHGNRIFSETKNSSWTYRDNITIYHLASSDGADDIEKTVDADNRMSYNLFNTFHEY